MAKILVFGGTRFFGKHLVEQLLEQKHDVTIATRGNVEASFDRHVTRCIVDRTDTDALLALFEEQTFDVVYDNICYTPQQAKQLCDVLNGKGTRVVFTSTMATYAADGERKTEQDFEPRTYTYDVESDAVLSYGEGKKQAEAVYTAYATFPVTIVRFPIVMGTDDYTERLVYYVERIMNEQPVALTNVEAKMGFITSLEAGAFLAWIGCQQKDGIWNAVSDGDVTMGQLIEKIERAAQKKATIAQGSDSPYSIPASWYMSNEKAKRAGFSFSTLDDWLDDLIAYDVRHFA